MIARKAIGLEGSILDHDLMEVAALDDADSRRFTVRVAGPAALIVAKVYKLRDRLAEGKVDRIAGKVRTLFDALPLDVVFQPAKVPSMSQSPSTMAARTLPRCPRTFARRTGWRPRQESNLRHVV